MVEETLTNRESRWRGVSYNEICNVVSETYRGNPDIRIPTLADNLGLSFDVVWECLGFRDYFDFEDTEDS